VNRGSPFQRPRGRPALLGSRRQTPRSDLRCCSRYRSRASDSTRSFSLLQPLSLRFNLARISGANHGGTPLYGLLLVRVLVIMVVWTGADWTRRPGPNHSNGNKLARGRGCGPASAHPEPHPWIKLGQDHPDSDGKRTSDALSSTRPLLLRLQHAHVERRPEQ
jgi:hypothetical protein